MQATLTNIDTEQPPEALISYWNCPEFKSYLEAKERWKAAHVAYVVFVGISAKAQHDAGGSFTLRFNLTAAADEARRRLAICRALTIHKEAFGW